MIQRGTEQYVKTKKILKILTVTLSSKKYLSVKDKPRTISVRNSIFMLLSKTETNDRKSGPIKGPCNQTLPSNLRLISKYNQRI